MKYKYGYTICVSSQVGCKMGCTFCASTLAGFKRNLSAGEIEGQLHSAQKDLGIRISHIVMMGIGEPLDNFDNVIAFLNNINNENGLNISMRNITISTCGIVPRIYDLMNMDLQLTLTISLHAPNDKIRSSTMPINNKYNIDELLNACRLYASKTGRRVSFEYTLIKGVNDSEKCAKELCDRLKGILCHVNLIPVNDVKERNNIRSSKDDIIKFCNILKRNGINATIRRTLGADINASCGQLRRMKNRGEIVENSCKD
jgi:23S rRNA (adenine2503-C2)-methyltransferase